MALQPDAQPFIVTVVETPAPEVTILDVVLGSLGVVAALFVLAVGLGILVSMARLQWRRRHPPEGQHMPPVAPTTTE